MAAASEPLSLQADVSRALELLEKLQKSGEVPSAKLVALQEVLRSEFLGAVRGVYEHVYETVVMPGSPETRASATAKATVAAFAASEGQAHPRLIRLSRTEHGFGFNIAGGEGPDAPVLVSRVLASGAAERQGGLRRGDQLITVDGRPVEGETHGEVVRLLREAGDQVTLLVRHAPELLDALERRLESARAAAARASGR
ncbi:protein lin-7 homolog C-like [Amphibalanus amphitrite]|uniref:protein lin-7 homolog C-like n=1 Tax=Amphibalanus amphitrite TaxID=1232801 RepID=UPI001C908995|nr:protein lin-7 homolog C-like [Amphibalanus amphitrite]